jgi:hypothetical protein
MHFKSLKLCNIIVVKKSTYALRQQKNMENEFLKTKKYLSKFNQDCSKQINLVKLTKYLFISCN